MSPLLTLAAFEKIAPELHYMPDIKWAFSEQEAVKEIVRCLEQPNGRKLIVELLLKYHLSEKNEVVQKRWKQLLTAIFLEPTCKFLFYTFLKKLETRKDADETPMIASILINTLCEKPDPDACIRNALSDYTHHELNYCTDPISHFRLGTLSSYLHASYCTLLLQDLFAQLSSVLDNCKADCFEELFPMFFGNLYSYPLPLSCKELLSTRRQQIYEFLLKTHSPEKAAHQSGILIGETLFLRVINPFLLNHHKDLIPLMKIAQALSDQVPFGTEKPNSSPQSFNKIYDAFIETHLDYINRHCILESEKRVGDFFSIEE